MSPSTSNPVPDTLAQRATVVGLVFLLIVGMAVVTWEAIPALITIFGGFLITLLLSGLARWLSDTLSMSYRQALAVGGIGIVVLVVGLTWLVGDGIASQLSGLVAAIPEALAQAEEALQRWLRRGGAESSTGFATLGEPVGQIVSGAFGMVNSVVGGVGSVVFAALIGVYLALSPKTYRQGLLRLVPIPRRERANEVIQAVIRAVRGWLVARITIMAITFVSSYIGLVWIGVPFAGGLAVVSAFAVLIPYVGAWISGTLAVLVALLVSPEIALYTALFYFGVQTLQGWTIEPLIEARYTAAPPALLLMAQVVLGLLLGAVGVLLASPIIIVVVILVQMLYVQDTLGDTSVHVLGSPETMAAGPAEAEAPAAEA